MYTDRHLDNLWQNGQRNVRYRQAGALASDMLDVLRKNNSSSLNKLRAGWVELVGEELGGLCAPLKLKSGVLTVGVYNSDVRFYIEQFHRSALLERIRELLDVRISDIKCIVDANIIDMDITKE